ncbi:MAG: tetratricopeptide repeat protein [Alphaproteobacteria bacterium]
MNRSDLRGLRVSGASDTALAHFERAVAAGLRMGGDPAADVIAALADSPDFAMAHALGAYLLLAGLEARDVARATAALPDLQRTARTDREKLHAAAIAAYAAGELDQAAERLEDLLIDHPRDVVALQQAHLLDLYRGDARALRDRVARFRHAWGPGLPGYHAVLAMHAFGMEECGDAARAEETGCEALAIEPRDAWAHHAVAHALEAQGRATDGIAWMRERQPMWSEDSFLAVHNWWHRALCHFELDDAGAALGIYDDHIRGAESGLVIDLMDASSLLWRLSLAGVDVGGRWAGLAERWAPTTCDGWYALSDVHAMMAFVGAARWDLADQILATLRRRVERGGTNRAMTADVGLPLARALYAFGRRDYTTAVGLLRPLRSVAPRFGGSNAQRDVIDLTLIEAAHRDKQTALLRALLHERQSNRPRGADGAPLRYAA